jgi:hypothetical protein
MTLYWGLTNLDSRTEDDCELIIRGPKLDTLYPARWNAVNFDTNTTQIGPFEGGPFDDSYAEYRYVYLQELI